jgi:hypothetical protein
MLEKQQLIGTYDLVSGQMKREDGVLEFPFGEDAIGYLAYTSDDFMWFEINAANRAVFEDGDWFGTQGENDEAMKTHLSLCAKYRIDGDELHYLMLASSSPNMVAMSSGQTYFHGATATLADNILRLISKPYLVDGLECQTQYIWRKKNR